MEEKREYYVVDILFPENINKDGLDFVPQNLISFLDIKPGQLVDSTNFRFKFKGETYNIFPLEKDFISCKNHHCEHNRIYINPYYYVVFTKCFDLITSIGLYKEEF